MPYFLTNQFKGILEASNVEKKKQLEIEAAHEGGAKNRDDGGHKDTGPVGIYKSIFLRTKVEQQNDKRKQNKKAGKPAGGSPR